ncbi:MAG: YheT family hydrolase [Candidatus Sericytochromatia bacterium]
MAEATDILPFAAPLWLKSGHLQTLYAALGWRPAPLPPNALWRVEIASQIALHCAWNQAGEQASPHCLILIHGLEGSAEVPYMISTARKALALGIDVVRVNLRGCQERPWTSQTSYHAALTQDLSAVVQEVQRAGYRALVIAGFSLGGHLTLKWASEIGESVPTGLQGVVAVSPPVDLAATAAYLQRPLNRGYDQYFLRRMQRTWRQRRRCWPEYTSLEHVMGLRSLREFDDQITAPAFGFANAADYYAQCSVGPSLRQIALPTEIILAEDDPIVPAESHRRWFGEVGSQVRWLLSAEGGHVGFYNCAALAIQDRDAWWAENRVLDRAQEWFAL